VFGINSIDNPGDYYIRKNPQSRIDNKVKTVFEVAELEKKICRQGIKLSELFNRLMK